MSEKEIDTILDRDKSLPELDRRIAAFTFVRDIAYGNIGSRDPLDVLAAKKGTCSGKHALLRILLNRLGYETQTWFAKHDFHNFPIKPWPEELNEFRELTLTDYHDFLKVKIGNQWVTLDAMFDKPLLKLGFPVQDWDGLSDMDLPVSAEELFKAEDGTEAHKKRLVEKMPKSVQKNRKKFLAELTKWIDSAR